jgi:DNA-binding transcriptional ArsR family regulator
MVTYCRFVKLIFKALGDSHRRLLLDRLLERDGQTLGELEAALPKMTRFGVMKHLNVLATANLITVRRVGRHKLHYLNPGPIRLALENWIGKYAHRSMATSADLSPSLDAHAGEPPRLVFDVYVRTKPQALWNAITSKETLHGKILEVDRPRRLVQTFERKFSEEDGDEPGDPSRVTWEITRQGDLCKLTLVHDGWTSESQSYRSARERWPMILSSLKSMMETGTPLEF